MRQLDLNLFCLSVTVAYLGAAATKDKSMLDPHSGARRKTVTGLGLCFCLGHFPAKAYDKGRRLRFSGAACALNGDVKLKNITAFMSSSEAKHVVADICNCVALPANFEIVAVKDSQVNAYATVYERQRYIVYDEDFMKSVADARGKNWAGLTIMAHEIGHHLSGHTLDNIGSRPPRELEADSFAGFVVGTLGGRLKDAIAVFKDTSETGSATHPPRQERIAAVTAGWQRVARAQQADKEQLNVITHNGRPDGSYARVVSEFVDEGATWVEYQHGQKFASFTEGARDREAVYLFDASRKIWLRITINTGARVSVGSWSSGEVGQLPTNWSPLDPVEWR